MEFICFYLVSISIGRINMQPKSTTVHELYIEELSQKIIVFDESRQYTGSFKYRAAWNLVYNVKAPMFIAASSGNFGQALAFACQQKKIPCKIIMPTTSAQVKIDGVRGFGAEVVFVDTKKQSRAQKVAEVAQTFPNAYIASAYDCDWIINGNASLGFDIAEKYPDLQRLVVPIGGGGLSSGIISGLCKKGCLTEVWGAEPLLANDAARSLRAGVRLSNEGEPQTIADGARTHSTGERNWRILKEGLKGIIEVDEFWIEKACQLYATYNIRVEPTGALSLGGLLQEQFQHRTENIYFSVGVVVSGGNVDDKIYDDILSKELTFQS